MALAVDRHEHVLLQRLLGVVDQRVEHVARREEREVVRVVGQRAPSVDADPATHDADDVDLRGVEGVALSGGVGDGDTDDGTSRRDFACTCTPRTGGRVRPVAGCRDEAVRRDVDGRDTRRHDLHPRGEQTGVLAVESTSLGGEVVDRVVHVHRQDRDAVVGLGVVDEDRVHRRADTRDRDRTRTERDAEQVERGVVVGAVRSRPVVRAAGEAVGLERREVVGSGGGRPLVDRVHVAAVGERRRDGRRAGEVVVDLDRVRTVHDGAGDRVGHGARLDHDIDVPGVRTRTRRFELDGVQRRTGAVLGGDGALGGRVTDDTGHVALRAALFEEGPDGVVQVAVGGAPTEPPFEVRDPADEDGDGGRSAIRHTGEERLTRLGENRRGRTRPGCCGDVYTGHVLLLRLFLRIFDQGIR